MRRAALLVAAFVVAIALVAPPIAASTAGIGPTYHGHASPTAQADALNGPSTPATSPTIVRTMAFSLTPSKPGSVNVQVRYDVPSNLGTLTTTVPSDATVIGTDGFSRNADGTYTWRGGTSSPSLTLALPANRTGAGLRSPGESSGYEFVDTGPWAIVQPPPMSTSWTYRGTPPTFDRRVTTATEGVAGDQMVYLGPSAQYHRTFDGQTMTLVVPAAATLAEPPSHILNAISNASRALTWGDRTPTVTFIAAPTSVSWAAEGLASGSDAWVQADRRLDTPDDVWIHEYVHTRTDFRATADAQWLVEASAEYYAALLTLEQGRIDFRTFHDHLERGSRYPYASSVMSQPSTWVAGANYLKGGLVLGDLDRRMRLATDSAHPASDLIAAMNRHDGPVDYSFVRRTVADLAGSSVATELDKYATTSAVPTMWTREQHAQAFSKLPPRIVVGSSPTYAISGPFRNGSVATPPVLVPGETLIVNTTVTNEGDVAGPYNVTLRVNGTAVDGSTGSLDGNASTTVPLRTTFDSPGTYTVTTDGSSTQIRVEPPASPKIASLTADPTAVAVGDSVTLTVTATNPADRPATATLPILVDGTTVSTWTPKLNAGATATAQRTITIESPGTHVVQVGASSVQISATGQGTGTATTGGHTTGIPVPGFGVEEALLVLLGFLGIGTWLASRRDR